MQILTAFIGNFVENFVENPLEAANSTKFPTKFPTKDARSWVPRQNATFACASFPFGLWPSDFGFRLRGGLRSNPRGTARPSVKDAAFEGGCGGFGSITDFQLGKDIF